MQKLLFFGLLPLFLVQPLTAVFTYGAHIANGQKNIYFFNDVHDANDVAPMQQIHVVSFAKKLNATLLTEEMTDIYPLRSYLYNQNKLAQIEKDCLEHLQKEESDKFPLRGLALFARAAGVNARNIDYRQWADAFRTGRTITGRMAMRIIDKVITEIQQFDDHPILNKYYEDSIKMVTDAFQPMWDYLRSKDQTVAALSQTEEFKEIIDSIKGNPEKKGAGYRNYWITFDSRLFDCILLHELFNRNNQHIIVCAGGFHCNVAIKLFKQIGYRLEFGRGVDTGSITPMHMPAFTSHILKEKLHPCMDEQMRTNLMNCAMQEMQRKYQMGMHLPWIPVGILPVILMLFTCLYVMGLTCIIIYYMYRQRIA